VRLLVSNARTLCMPAQLGAARKPGCTSIASLLLVLTEATRCIAALARERARHHHPTLDGSDLAYKVALLWLMAVCCAVLCCCIVRLVQLHKHNVSCAVLRFAKLCPINVACAACTSLLPPALLSLRCFAVQHAAACAWYDTACPCPSPVVPQSAGGLRLRDVRAVAAAAGPAADALRALSAGGLSDLV
jgi:hypothetical protein